MAKTLNPRYPGQLYDTELDNPNPDDIPWSSNYNMIEVNPDDIDKLKDIAKTKAFKDIAFDISIEFDETNYRYVINMPDGLPGSIADKIWKFLRPKCIGMIYHL